MKKAFKWTALLLAFLMLGGCAQKANKDVPELLEPAGIQSSDTAVAYVGEIYRTLSYSASITPYVEALSFNVSGEVMEIYGSPGMTVEEGDVLIELDQVSMQERTEQLQKDISYTQKDGEYSNTIADLDIQILKVELRQLQKTQTELKEKETEYKEKETALKEKETALKENETTLAETEAALKEKEAALTEKAAALKEAEPTPEVSEPAPETSEPAPETSEPAPEASEPAPETSEPAPETSEPAPETSEPAPETSDSAPETSEPAPEASEPAPAESTPTPRVSEPTAEKSELEFVEEELLKVKEELIQIAKERLSAKEELPKIQEELQLIAEELPEIQKKIPLTEKEIALKENEIEKAETFLRQDKELRALDIQNKQKEISELGESLSENSIYAPFSGRIIYGDSLAPGSWVTAEDPVVFLADDSKMSISCSNVPETEIEYADRVFAKIGAKEYELKHIPMDPDEYTKKVVMGEEIITTFEIIATEKELEELEIGQFAQVCLWRDYVKDALLVPINAVMVDSSGKYVYVEENGHRVKRTVKTGKESASLIQIVEGLKEGDVVHVKE